MSKRRLCLSAALSLLLVGCLRGDGGLDGSSDTTAAGSSTTTGDTSSGSSSSSGPGVETSTDAGPSSTSTDSSTGPASTCGDGELDPGEQCDDGDNNSDLAACKLDCTLAACGDGLVQPGELCDDGNPVDSDACTTACQPAACGDGFLQLAELCDDGNQLDSDACTAACAPNVCGDGHLHLGVEACDEPMATADCDADCSAPACGDGELNQAAGEQCDDGNDVDTDACTTACAPAACGDGHLQAGEQCDDGGLTVGDGCDAACKKETVKCQNLGAVVSVAPNNRAIVCERPELCEKDYAILCPKGWHLCSANEFNARNSGWNYAPTRLLLGAIRCREGAGAGQYGFKSNLSVDHADNCSYSSSRPQCVGQFGCDEKNNYALCCAPLASCGNGVKDHPEEQCDDGNKSDDDECLNNCVTTHAPGAQGCG